MFKLFSRHLYSRRNSTNFFLSMLLPFFAMSSIVPEGGGVDPDKEKLMNEILEKFNAQIEEKTKEFVKPDELKAIKRHFEDAIKQFDEQGLKEYKATIEKLNSELITVKELAEKVKEIAKEQSIEIDKLKAPEAPSNNPLKKLSRDDKFKTLISNAFKSKAFKDFKGTGFKGFSQKMTLLEEDNKIQLVDPQSIDKKDSSVEKVVIPITSHSGTVMISDISDVVRDNTPTRKSHIRDLMNVRQTDGAQIVAGQVTGWTDALTLGATVLSENESAPESVYTSLEVTWSVKRIANSMRISKRWFKVNGLQWVIDHVIAKLPDATYTVEDFELLFGDGSGDHVDGLAKNAQSFDLTPQVYVATAFASIATWNSAAQTIVTFAAAHNMKNGDNLVLANTTGTTYDGTHTAVEVVNAKQVIIDQAYTADANVAANWTGSSQSIFYHAIDNAQEYDVLSVSKALLEAAEFGATGHAVNPQQRTQMGLLKATTADYLNIQKDMNGEVVGVGGLPIVATTAVPAGKFFSGDFSRNGVELAEFTPLSMQFVEDVTTAKANELVVVIDEEIIFPIYNPYGFYYGKFVDAKVELETP